MAGDRAGNPPPGCLARRAGRGRGPARGARRPPPGSASRSSSRRHRRRPAGRSRTSCEPERGLDVAAGVGEVHRAGAVRAGRGCARRCRRRPPRRPAPCGRRGTRTGRRPANGSRRAQAERDRAGSRSPVACPPAPGRSAVGVDAKTARTVSLNWRRLPNPAPKATSPNGRSVVSMQDPGGLRPLGPGERERAGTELGDEQAVEVAGAVPEPAGEAGHALPVDDPVGDEAHGAGRRCRRGCSTRGAGRRVGPAPLAGPEPGRLRRGRGREEADVGALRCAGGAARPAVDAGGRDGHDEPAVEAGVAALHRPGSSARDRRSRTQHGP